MKQKIKTMVLGKTKLVPLNKVVWAKQFQTCHVPYNKFWLSLLITGTIACLVTPFTNWAILPLFKFVGARI